MDGRVGDYVHRYRSLGLTGSPMTPDQIAELERSLGLPLPAAYMAHLLIAGASPPPELIGSDCHGDRLYKLREWADELILECGRPFELPPDAVVFIMHQGYQFMYFRTDGTNDDPPVYSFLEGMTGP